MKGLLFTYLMTYGGAILAIFQPFYGLLIFFMFGILKPEILWHWSVPKGSYSMTIMMATMIGWALSGMGDWRLGKAWPVMGCIIGYLLWSSFSAMLAPVDFVAWRFVENNAKIIVPLVIGITLIDSVAKLRMLAWTYVLAYGYLAFEFNLNYYNGVYGGGIEVEHGMDNNSVCIGIVVAVGLSMFVLLTAKRLWQKGLVFFFLACLAHTILFSNSRGGMVALICTGLVAFFLVPKQPKHFAWLFVGAILAIRLAGPPVQERFATIFAEEEERDESAQSRLILWKAMWAAAKDSPVTGVGPDHWTLIAHHYGRPEGQEGHSLWLQILAELGFPGLLLLISFYGFCVLMLLWLVWERRNQLNPDVLNLARGVIAALVGFAVSAQFVSLEGLEIPYYVTLLGAGILKLTSDLPPPHLQRRAAPVTYYPEGSGTPALAP